MILILLTAPKIIEILKRLKILSFHEHPHLQLVSEGKPQKTQRLWMGVNKFLFDL